METLELNPTSITPLDTARWTISSIGRTLSALTTSADRALVAGCFGVKSVQQSWSGMIEIG